MRGRPRFRFVEADVCDLRATTPAIAGTDVLVHLAARAGVRASVTDPASYVAINVTGTQTVLDAASRAGVRRVVFASSSSVYGDAPLPFTETWSGGTARSPYATTKRAGEELCARSAREHGLRIAALRLFSVYGPGQRPDQAVHRFARALSTGRVITRFGDGSTSRDYTYVDDVVAGIMRSVDWTAAHGSAYEVFNIGSGRAVELDRLIDLLARGLGVAPCVRTGVGHPADVAHTLADLRKAGRMLGYAPRVSVDDGITAFLSWFEVAYGRQPRAAS